jgi:hypothetical protein
VNVPDAHLNVVLVAKRNALALEHTIPDYAPLVQLLLSTGGMIFLDALKGHVGKLHVV